MRPDDVGGVHIKYLYHCHRQLWLFARGIRPEHRSNRVAVGEAVHDVHYPRHRVLDLGPDQLDHFDRHGWVHETKSSATPRPADQAQARHYCHRLHQLGVAVAGAIPHYPAIRRTIQLAYDTDAAAAAAHDIREALDAIAQPTPPERLDRPRCHGCSFTDYCWSE